MVTTLQNVTVHGDICCIATYCLHMLKVGPGLGAGLRDSCFICWGFRVQQLGPMV